VVLDVHFSYLLPGFLLRLTFVSFFFSFNAEQTMGTTIRHSLELKMGQWQNPIFYTGKGGQKREGVLILSKLQDQVCQIVLMHVGHAHRVD
jgi:hypothetical protein